MQIPDLLRDFEPNLKGIKDAYLKLNKSLYGLKQAPREWFQIVKKFFKSIGLKSAEANPNLFIGNKVYILLFVNDMLIAGKRQDLNITKTRILREWRCKDLGPAEVFVGFQIDRDRTNRTLKLHQTMYTKKLLERLKMDNCNPTKLPIPAGTVLKADIESPLEYDDATVYRQIIGSTIYLSNCTRLDISYAVGQLARFMAAPGESHYRLSKQLLRYLNGTLETGITYLN